MTCCGVVNGVVSQISTALMSLIFTGCAEIGHLYETILSLVNTNNILT